MWFVQSQSQEITVECKREHQPVIHREDKMETHQPMMMLMMMIISIELYKNPTCMHVSHIDKDICELSDVNDIKCIRSFGLLVSIRITPSTFVRQLLRYLHPIHQILIFVYYISCRNSMCVCACVCFYASSIIDMQKEKNDIGKARQRMCVRLGERASERARKCVINVPSIQFLYTCSNIYNVIANTACDNLSISVSFVIWGSNYAFTLALMHQLNFDRVSSVVFSSLKASQNYG